MVKLATPIALDLAEGLPLADAVGAWFEANPQEFAQAYLSLPRRIICAFQVYSRIRKPGSLARLCRLLPLPSIEEQEAHWKEAKAKADAAGVTDEQYADACRALDADQLEVLSRLWTLTDVEREAVFLAMARVCDRWVPNDPADREQDAEKGAPEAGKKWKKAPGA